jgi:regulatory protein
MRLYRQTVEDHGLYSGMELSEQQMKDLRSAAGQMSAKMRAVRIVTASNVSRRDLEERLIRKGEQPDQAREAVAWMENLDLVDDARTAAQIVSQCARKGYGIARAKQALYEKRIPKEYWEEALSDYPDQSEYILDFLRRQLGEDRDQRQVKRAVDALLRRGHNYHDIRRCLRTLDADDFLEDAQWH